jgi:hypothetical protein
VIFAGGCINALILFEGHVLRTAEPASTSFGVAQVRRFLSAETVGLVHVVFAPITPRPLLLGVVRLKNRGDEPVQVDYTELWDVQGTDHEAAAGACSCRSAEGTRALADVAIAVRARAPEAPSHAGLALDLRILLPPRSHRQLYFAYAAPQPGEDAALLVRAWRGDVMAELRRTVASFVAPLQPGSDAISAYRRQVATFCA